jgi:hypothetical protein
MGDLLYSEALTNLANQKSEMSFNNRGYAKSIDTLLAMFSIVGYVFNSQRQVDDI